MKIAILGCGSIGGAVALGLSRCGVFLTSDITVTAGHASSLDQFAALGFRTSLNNAEAVLEADIVMISVRSYVVKQVVEEIRDVLDYSRQTIVSMAAEYPSEELLSLFRHPDGSVPQVVKVIPNTALEARQSMTFLASVNADKEHLEQVRAVFNKTGKTLLVEEEMLGAGTTLASCGIGYAMAYVKAAAEGGNRLGFTSEDAVRIVAQTVRGAVALLEMRDFRPEDEITKVATPGGLTEKGLKAMEESGFTDAVIRGLTASAI